jgi:hypothetical protein
METDDAGRELHGGRSQSTAEIVRLLTETVLCPSGLQGCGSANLRL